jgi:hypothetical protein
MNFYCISSAFVMCLATGVFRFVFVFDTITHCDFCIRRRHPTKSNFVAFRSIDFFLIKIYEISLTSRQSVSESSQQSTAASDMIISRALSKTVWASPTGSRWCTQATAFIFYYFISNFRPKLLILAPVFEPHAWTATSISIRNKFIE